MKVPEIVYLATYSSCPNVKLEIQRLFLKTSLVVFWKSCLPNGQFHPILFFCVWDMLFGLFWEHSERSFDLYYRFPANRFYAQKGSCMDQNNWITSSFLIIKSDQTLPTISLLLLLLFICPFIAIYPSLLIWTLWNGHCEMVKVGSHYYNPFCFITSCRLPVSHHLPYSSTKICVAK